MLNGIDRGVGALVRVAAFIGVLSLVALMALTVVTVGFRAVRIAFPGTYVLAELLLIPAVCCALAYAAWTGAHTRVELLTQTFPKRVAQIVHGIVLLLSLGFWGIVAYAALEEVLRRSAQGETSPILDIPVAPFRWIMFAGIVLVIAVILLRAVQSLLGKDVTE